MSAVVVLGDRSTQAGLLDRTLRLRWPGRGGDRAFSPDPFLLE